MEELAAAFALEALPPDELDAYRTHLLACEVCRYITRDFLAVADALPLGLDEPASPPGLKARILAQAEAGDVGLRTEVDAEKRRRGTRRFGWRSPLVPRLLVAALVVLVLGLAAWNVSLQLRLNPDPEPGALAARQLLAEGIAAGGQIIRLSGTDAAPEADGALIEIPGPEVAVLLVRNLRSLPPNFEYQVWRIDGNVAVSAGTFSATPSEVQLVALTLDFSDAEAVGVSIEPTGGSQTPTPDAIVLLGTR